MQTKKKANLKGWLFRASAQSPLSAVGPLSQGGGSAQRRNHIGRCLHQFNQHALPRQSGTRHCSWGAKRDVVARSAPCGCHRGKAHALGGEPFHGLGRSSIHRPMWLSGVVCTAGFFDVQRLHDVHLHLEGALAHGQDVSSTFRVRSGRCRSAPARACPPTGSSCVVVGAANGDLLDAQDFEGGVGLCS